MNSSREAYLQNFESILQKMLSTTKAKNADYASGADAFQNFRNVEQMGLTTVEVGILTRMSDKFQRAANLLKREAFVKTESVEDTLLDLAVYTIILLCYLKSKQGPKPGEVTNLSEKEMDDLLSGRTVYVKPESVAPLGSRDYK